MPDTQPTKAAAIARNLCSSPDHKDADGNYEYEGFSDRPCICPEAAMALDAYAAERIEETHANVRGAVAALEAERDAALAKLEAAEAEAETERDNIAREALQAIVAQQRAEDRVRVLEACMAKIIRQCPECSETPIICDNDEHIAIKAALCVQAVLRQQQHRAADGRRIVWRER